ncbi:MAG TPA: tetratricopeptide repeat protein [Cyclobacteriaceae bacterium]|nr:tetratricopeptide repeat protein [Cyclobacteriaceae bacterium]
MPRFLLLVLVFVTGTAMAQDPKWKKWEIEADTLMNRQDFEGAIKLYSKAIKSSKLEDKSSYSPVYKRAVCYYSIGQIDASLKDIETFMVEYPNLFQGHMLKAFIYRETDDTTNQLNSLNEAMALQPGDPGLIKWRASLYLEEGKYEKVKEDLQYVRAIQNDPEVEMYLGFAYYNLDQVDSAFISLNKAIELEPTYLPAYLYGGSFSLQESNNEMALKYLDVALKLDPENLNAQFYKGIALLELDRVEEGCSLLAKAFYAGEDDAGDYLKEKCYTLTK